MYFGRLSREKGLFTLLEAINELPEVTLKIIGTGPLEGTLGQTIRSRHLKNVQLLGHRTGNELRQEVSRAMFTVLPSEWYENHPRAILEGFAMGKPAVATRMGGIPELVREGQTGLLCEPKNPEDLRAKIRWLVQHPAEITRMGRRARQMVEEELSGDLHYQHLMEIYGSVMGAAQVSGR